MTPKPFIKWAGGKSRLLQELLPRVPSTMRVYAEPFAGGAALFFAVVGDRKKPCPRAFERAILADRNQELVICYRTVRDSVEQVIEALRSYRYDKDVFYQVREQNPEALTDIERAARFIYLNRTCFNGLWRVNSSGKFNVPFGRYKNPRIVDEEGLRAGSEALRSAEITTCDFAEITSQLSAGDFVYLDPPYAPATKTANFTDYVADGFSNKDQVRLVEAMRDMRDRGVLAMLSNSDTPETRSLYGDFAVYGVRAPRAINSDPQKRGDVGEIVVTSWGLSGFLASPASALPASKIEASP